MTVKSDPRSDEGHAQFMIDSIKTLDELDGYEAEAKRRSLSPHEVALIFEKRKQLTPKREGNESNGCS